MTLAVLEEYLTTFDGCVIVVSHDRYFMDQVVDHLFVFRGNGIVDDFPGNYSDFRIYEDSRPKVDQPISEKVEKPIKKTVNSKLSYLEKKEYNSIEQELMALENSKTEIEKQFTETTLSGEAINKLALELESVKMAIVQKEERWMYLMSKLED